MEAIAKPQKEVAGFRLVLGYLGMFMVLIGLISAIPLVVVAFYPSEAAALPIFGSVSGVNIVVGITLYLLLIWRRKRSRFFRHQESMLLVLTWICAILSGAAPFFIGTMIHPAMNMGFSASVFEATSGYSTTGLTVFSDFIDVNGAFCPHVYTFHRALMNFIGGVGLVLLVASVLGAGGGGVALYVSEGHSDRVLPNIAKSAKLIFGIYLFYTVIGAVALMFAGMPPFDAVCHSMSALSGGGFSPRAFNVGAFRPYEGLYLDNGFMPVNSLAIEILIMLLVTLSAISFMLHTFLLRGKFREFFRDDETKYGLIAAGAATIIGFVAILVTTESFRTGFFDGAGEAFRTDIFYVIGTMTNSGFSITGTSSTFNTLFHIAPNSSAGWPLFTGHAFTIILILLMLVGGGAGSSAGGIKQYRVAVFLRSTYYSLRYRFASIHHRYPRITYRYGQQTELEESTISDAHHYLLIYVLLYLLIVVGVMLADPNYEIGAATFDVASAISNTGLSWRIGPGYVDSLAPSTVAGNVNLWLMTIAMIGGRLEILPFAYATSSVIQEVKYHRQQRLRARHAAAMDISEGE